MQQDKDLNVFVCHCSELLHPANLKLLFAPARHMAKLIHKLLVFSARIVLLCL